VLPAALQGNLLLLPCKEELRECESLCVQIQPHFSAYYVFVLKLFKATRLTNEWKLVPWWSCLLLLHVCFPEYWRPGYTKQ